MGRNLAGKRVVLTGASSGIGKALAVELAKAGAHLVLAARSADKLDALAKTLTGTTVFTVPTELAKADQRENLIRTAVEKLGGLDLLINNAGIASWGHFATSDEAVMREVMEINFFAPTDLIRLAIPHLTNGNEAAIVNVSSMCGRRGMPAWPEYSASKFALCGITESLRSEMARFDIEVILIVPGMAKTSLRENMARNEGKAKLDFEKGMPAEDVAARILNGIIKGKREVVIGSDAKWMLRMHRWFPRLLDRLICRRVKKLYAQAPAAGK
ncbi:MAG: SDR family oxidoreductase [Planctomycetes bacterium]|nr:SDR family oxidoreductase [Planctomycetota bacterium]